MSVSGQWYMSCNSVYMSCNNVISLLLLYLFSRARITHVTYVTTCTHHSRDHGGLCEVTCRESTQNSPLRRFSHTLNVSTTRVVWSSVHVELAIYTRCVTMRSGICNSSVFSVGKYKVEALIPSRISGREYNIGPVFLCVCVSVS